MKVFEILIGAFLVCAVIAMIVIALSVVDIFRTVIIIQERHLEDCKLRGYENIYVNFSPIDWDTIESDRPFGRYSVELRLRHYIVYCIREEKIELYNAEGGW